MNVPFIREVLCYGMSPLREECVKSSGGLSYNKCCGVKLIDSRDTDFNHLKNRIAYMYRFGESIITLVETCVSNYFAQCSMEEMLYFVKNCKICSLSNGPGLDIIGYLIALIKSNEQLNCNPVIKSINLYESWREIFQTITSVAIKKCPKSYIDNGLNLYENILFIQCDIFSTLTTEAEKCIENSDILLMCRVFSSTNASTEIVSRRLKEIFKLLKPGSIVFFIAGRRNMKNVSTLYFLKKFVNIKFGPCKATSENAPLDTSVPDTTGLKPEQRDRSYFMVLEKKFIIEHKDLNTSQRIPGSTGEKSSKMENNVILTPSVSSCDVSITDSSEVEYTDIYNSNIEYTDIDSISLTSSYKDSDITKSESETQDESKSVSCEYLHQLGVTHQIVEDSVKQEQSENLSNNTFQIKLQTYLNENRNKELTSNINGPIVENEDCFKSVHDDALREFDEKLKSNMPKENVNQYTCKNELMEVIASYSNNKDDSLNENILTDVSSPNMTCKTSVEFEKPVESEQFTIKDPASEDASTDQFPSSVKYIPSHKKILKEKSCSEQIKSVSGTNCLDKKLSIEKEILIMRSRKSLQELSPQCRRSCENLFQSFNKYSDPCEERKQKPSSDCFKELFRNSTDPSVINSASFNRKNLKTKTENMQEEIKKSTSENPLHSSNNSRCTKESIDRRNGDAVNSMIEHCENLVTSLESLVASMSKNIDSINNQRLHKHCCKTESQPNCSHSCACSDYCSELSYLRKKCCCKRINNHVCLECSKSACNRIYNHQIHSNNYAVDSSGNSKQPYLVLPVRNEDIPSILHLVSKTS